MSTSGATRQAKKSRSCHLLHLGNVTVRTPLAQALVYLDGGSRESAGIWHAGASRRSDRSHVSIKNASRRDSHSVKTEAQVRGEHWRHSSLFKYLCYQACTVADSYGRFPFRRQESIHRIGCATIKSDGMYRAISYIKLEDAFLVTFASPQGNKAFSRPLKFVWSCLEPTPKPSRINSCKIRGVPRILALI